MKTHAYFPGGVCLYFLLAILFSCRSSREMMYLRDVKGQKQVLNGLPANPPLYRLKPKDNLFISIISSNPDLNRIYNPYQVSTNKRLVISLKTWPDSMFTGMKSILKGMLRCQLSAR